MTFQRHEHAVLDVVIEIRGSLSGTGDPLPRTELQHYADWLTWRLNEGWTPSAPGWEAFESAVRRLAASALGLALAELAEPAR